MTQTFHALANKVLQETPETWAQDAIAAVTSAIKTHIQETGLNRTVQNYSSVAGFPEKTAYFARHTEAWHVRPEFNADTQMLEIKFVDYTAESYKNGQGPEITTVLSYNPGTDAPWVLRGMMDFMARKMEPVHASVFRTETLLPRPEIGPIGGGGIGC
jgi:hypothetical protein